MDIVFLGDPAYQSLGVFDHDLNDLLYCIDLLFHLYRHGHLFLTIDHYRHDFPIYLHDLLYLLYLRDLLCLRDLLYHLLDLPSHLYILHLYIPLDLS